MYESFFKLHGRPFLAAPHTARYFPASSIESARQTLVRAIERGEGPGLIMGAPGLGKTLLCQLLAEQFADRFAVASLASGRLGTRLALLQAILYELGLPYRGLDEGVLRLTLLDHLEPGPAKNGGLLLLVDEAHTLSWKLLEEIRLISNLVRDGQPRVRVVLAGNSLLEERFASPKLVSFAQRIAARCYLTTMTAQETSDYVRAQIGGVGGDPAQLFDDEALQTIFRATDGIPRLVNQVCDHALILASLGGLPRLTSEAIEEAWADLQQLPAPGGETYRRESAGHVVEFGALDEPSEEIVQAIPFRALSNKEATTSQPEKQLDRIEEQLSTLDGGFTPAGVIGSEIDLDFPEFGDPFREHFAEEEVVLDRYSDANIFARAPRVGSWEGQQISRALDAWGLAPAQESGEGPQPNWTFASEEVEASPYDTAASVYEAPTSLAPPEATPSPGVSFPARQTPAVASASAVQPTPVETAAQSPLRAADDRDLIVVEDEPTNVRLPTLRPVARKLEYRQLFARLRRG